MLEEDSLAEVEIVVVVQVVDQFGEGDGIEAELAEVSLGIDVRRRNLQESRDLFDECVYDAALCFGPGRAGGRCAGIRCSSRKTRQRGQQRLAESGEHAVRDHCKRRGSSKNAVECVQPIACRQRQQAAMRPHHVRSCRVDLHAAIAPQRPCDGSRASVAETGADKRGAMGGKCVEECVCARVIALSGVAQRSRSGRGQDKEIEWLIGRDGIKVQGTADLGSKNFVHFGAIFLDNQRIAYNSGVVEDPREAAVLRTNPLECGLDLRAVRDIHLAIDDGCAAVVQRVNPGLRIGGASPAAAQNDRRAIAAEVRGHEPAQAAYAASDPIHAVPRKRSIGFG